MYCRILVSVSGRDEYWKKAESIAGMKKPGLCGVLIHRLAAFCLPPGDGKAWVLFWRFQVVKKMREEPR